MAPIETHPSSGTRRRGRTSEEIIAEQKEQAAKEKARRTNAQKTAAPGTTNATPASTAVAPAKAATGTAVSMPAPDSRTNVQKYVDEIAPASIVGRLIKFSKEGSFVTADDGEPVPDTAEFIALCDETLVGWIKFNREKDSDARPGRVMGLLYDGFVMPPRNTLDDNDKTQWEPGLSGEPEDPWQHQVCLVLQSTETKELYTFATTSQTGRRAVGNLLRHFDRMQRTNAGEIPVVRLKSGGFNHKDDRIGWVSVPVFAIVGRVPRDSAARPDTSVAADMNDEIRF
jgi:hypothetical protein